MTEDDLIKRLRHSRRAMEKYRRYPGRQWAGGAENELTIVETEIAILRDLQRQFPAPRDHIADIISGWEEARTKLRTTAN